MFLPENLTPPSCPLSLSLSLSRSRFLSLSLSPPCIPARSKDTTRLCYLEGADPACAFILLLVRNRETNALRDVVKRRLLLPLANETCISRCIGCGVKLARRSKNSDRLALVICHANFYIFVKFQAPSNPSEPFYFIFINLLYRYS